MCDMFFTPRRVRLAALAFLLACGFVTNALRAAEFPYVAYVTTPDAYVRSGPGERHYPTESLPQGYAVEVYRHEAGGWCAIRPPQESFSWLAEHQVRPRGDGTAEVVAAQAVARVGSAVSPLRTAVQVIVPLGERVQLVPPQPNDDPRWVRIVAPAGEFRWIAAKQLSRQPPLEAEKINSPSTSGLDWHRAGEPDGTDFSHLQSGAEPISGAAPLSTAAAPVPEPIEIVEGSPAELQLTQYQAAPAADGFAPENSGAAGGGVRVRFPGAGQTKSLEVGSIAELEIALSQTVVLPTEHWQFGPLRAASEEMLAAANSPGEKAQLREVLERIAEFERIQQNRLSPASVAEAPRTQNPPAQPTAPAADPTRDLTGMVDELRDRVRADLEGKPAAGGGDQFAEEPLYDAVGRLKPVVSKRENAPQFALVDERGDVISFVTPAPDLNLSRYVGQRIGVNGSRGFMPEYRRAHVTAARVTPVEGTVRR